MRGGALWEVRESRVQPLADDVRRAARRATMPSCSSGTIDDVVVGYGTLEFEVLADGRRLAVIGDLYVEPEARARRGRRGDRRPSSSPARSRPGARASTRSRCPATAQAKNFFERVRLHRARAGDAQAAAGTRTVNRTRASGSRRRRDRRARRLPAARAAGEGSGARQVGAAGRPGRVRRDAARRGRPRSARGDRHRRSRSASSRAGSSAPGRDPEPYHYVILDFFAVAESVDHDLARRRRCGRRALGPARRGRRARPRRRPLRLPGPSR